MLRIRHELTSRFENNELAATGYPLAGDGAWKTHGFNLTLLFGLRYFWTSMRDFHRCTATLAR